MKFDILTDKEIAEKARTIIVSDLCVYDSLLTLCNKVGTSPYKLNKAFKKYHGMLVTEFSHSVRMDKAKELLTNSNYTLQLIAIMTGFSEGNNFQASFKRAEGCTPGEWRRNPESRR